MVPLLFLAAILVPLSAAAQDGGTLGPPERAVGRELRVAEDDRVVGTVRAFEQGTVVVELDETGRAVAVPADRITRQDNKLYLRMPAEELATLPDHEALPPDAPADDLPYGGLTPGWGGAPSGSR